MAIKSALAISLALALPLTCASALAADDLVAMQPANGAQGVNPDTHLVLRFAQPPVLGASGKIRIYDAADDRLVDTLDLSIPAGPSERTKLPQAPYLTAPYPYPEGPRRTNADTKAGTPSAGVHPVPVAEPGVHQLTIIGGFTDGFHFHPVIVRDKTATITPHHNLLDYGKRYYVQVDPGVIEGFKGIDGKHGWRFSTKPKAPPVDARRVTVGADGSGDFNTVQGALDFVPDHPARRTTILVRNGDYEEIVYFRNKSNLTIEGEHRAKVRIHYANNEVFNPHPANISTNEVPGTFPSRRAAFAADNVKGVHLRNLTIATTLQGQAEGLLITGSENIVSKVTVIGSGDALQVNGSAYLADVKVVGGGDTILGRGPAFFHRCRIESTHAYMWIRNPATNHGNVFVDCSFHTPGGGFTELARSPVNKGKAYPHAEAVLINATLSGISPEGWGPIGGDAANVRFWEYNSRHPDGTPVDTSKRHPASRQLTMENDAELIRNYSTPSWVLDGWTPEDVKGR